MRTLSLFALLACLCLSMAANTWSNVNSPADDEAPFSFKVALMPQNMSTLDRLFWEISDPKSPFYGNHLTNEQIADLISLPTEDIEQVLDFLTAKSGEVCDVVARLGLHRDIIFVDTCAGQAKKIFPNLDLATYELSVSNERVYRHSTTMDIEQNLYLLGVPAKLHQYILAIHDVTDLPHKAEKEIDISLPWLKTDKELTINDMIEYFDIDYSLLKSSTLEEDEGQVRLGVIEMFIAFSKDGLSDFQHKYNIPSNPVRKIEGFAFIPNAEANLDVQTLTSVAQNVHVWDFVFGPFFDFEHIVDKIMGTSGAPKIYSFSFGMPETKFGESKVKSSNQSLMKFGLGGYTFVTASGDSGPVLNPDNCSIFDAEFPGASPYVLSVGGTVLNTTANDQEQAWIHSSGGFSVYAPRPSYQNEKVEAYLKSDSLPSNTNKKYNPANRAYPDVSAFGAYEPLWTGGSYTVVGGTSGAAPQFAANLAMVNIIRYQNGLGPLGFVNQALYDMPTVGEDVVAGMNYATSRLGCSGQYLPGFKAVPGWDASTGLGSPKFPTLVAALGNKSGSKKVDVADIIETGFLA